MTRKPIFRSAITDEKGDVDVGYLSLMWGLVGWGAALSVVLGMGILSAHRAPDTAATVIKAIGDAIIGISAGFAAMLGAVGLFRAGDKPREPATGKTVTTETTTQTVTPGLAPVAPSDPIQVAVVKMPAAKLARKRR